MDAEKNELDELSSEIRKIISGNKKFLDRIMDDEFEPDEEIEEVEEVEEVEEEAGTIVEL
jgi:hypothetical protein